MKRPVGQRLMVMVLALAALGATVLIALNVFGRSAREHKSALPVLYKLPPFTLTDEQGKTITLHSLRDKVWVADFVFTRCTGPCPMMTSKMATLQQELEKLPQWKDIRLVSITVDPDYDTPKVLAEYAHMARADLSHWLFLTGPKATVYPLIEKDFHLPVAGGQSKMVGASVLHSTKMVLVDRAGRIRGYYDALDSKGPDGSRIHNERAKLKADLLALAAE